MNFFLPCIRLFCCNRTPPSTLTDYYFDPKLVGSGAPVFEAHKIQNKVSETEFLEIREATIKAAGGSLKTTRIAYLLSVIFAVLCFLAGVVLYAIHEIDPSKLPSIDFPLWIKIVAFILPNVILQCFCKFSMSRTCKIIKQFFDVQNEQVYSARGINWLTRGTLLYIHVKIVDSELQAYPKYINNSQLGKAGNAPNFDYMNQSSNKEVLLQPFK